MSLCLFMFSGQTCRKAHLYLHFQPGAAEGGQATLQPSLVGVHEERVSRWHQLYREQRGLAPQTGYARAADSKGGSAGGGGGRIGKKHMHFVSRLLIVPAQVSGRPTTAWEPGTVS